MKAIVVEDEKRARETIKNLLSKMEIPVSVVGEADNAEDGMKLIYEKLPDVVFADIRMGEMTGIEMIRRLNEKKVETKYVIISGYSDFKYAQQCIELGVIGYILKPVTYEDIDHMVMKLHGKISGNSLNPEIKKQLPVLDLHKLESENESLLIKKAVRFVNENMGVPCRLSEVARVLKVSPEHLSRMFHQEMNMTFTDYVKIVKVDYSINLLKKTDMRINEVARSVGYENEKYFHNIFKDAIGVTPNQYRKMRNT